MDAGMLNVEAAGAAPGRWAERLGKVVFRWIFEYFDRMGSWDGGEEAGLTGTGGGGGCCFRAYLSGRGS
jgi:hypothetical protein